ncbi:replication initiation and membrane attachment family protein [Sporolactobacillus sp. THM7-4]|nr:replication initiation and membrane attachment family protein [Sporolactobacillus sp. THM7-4]
MLQSWREVLPGDRYMVKADGLLHFYDQKLITRLYQPLVGIEATSLYFTLWQEIDHGSGDRSETHHHLMASMDLSLDRILTARKKLEAVGLFKTLKKKNKEPGFFIYQLIPPLTPNRFFNDGLLNIFLYHQVGSRDYNKLARLFLDKPLQEGDFEDLSASFDDVFESVPSSEIPDEEISPVVSGERRWEDRSRPQEPQLKSRFNFNALKGYLSEAIISEDALTPEVRAAVEKLAFIYRVDPFDMSRAIESASLHTGVVDIETLRKEVRDTYRLEHGRDEMPALCERRQPDAYREMLGREPQTDEEKTIAWFESITPYELLEDLGHGSKPAAPDLRLIENLMFDTKLNPGVVNVLIHYISIVNKNNLNKSFVEKVAAQWSRENVRTVREAMNLARKENRKHKAKDSHKRPAVSRRQEKGTHSEVVPEWMKNGKPERQDRDKKTNLSNEEVQKRAKWLEDYINSI